MSTRGRVLSGLLGLAIAALIVAAPLCCGDSDHERDLGLQLCLSLPAMAVGFALLTPLALVDRRLALAPETGCYVTTLELVAPPPRA
jgi:hypothetical protein